MKPFRPVLLLIVLVLTTTSLFASEREVVRHLTRPEPPVDPDARGKLELEQEGRSEQEFEVEIEAIDTVAFTYSLWMQDGPGSTSFVHVGDFVADPQDPTEATYERETGEGQSLPRNARRLVDLRDLQIEVRDDQGRVILLGVVPDIRRGTSGGSGGNHENEEVTSPLLRPANAPIPSATGVIEADADEGESELEIETEGFDVVASVYSVWIEDAGALLQMVGVLSPDDGRNDHGTISWETGEGQSLPLGATTLAELAHRRVEIRDDASRIVLEGEIPDIDARAPSRNVKQRLLASTAGEQMRAKGLARFTQKRGGRDVRIEVTVRSNATNGPFSLWIQNPATGDLEEVAAPPTSRGRGRNVRWSWRSATASLPFGVVRPESLVGRPLEVRDRTGAVLLTGSL